MEKEPNSFQEKKLNTIRLEALVDNFLQESSQYNVDCLDLKDAIVNIVIKWFEDYKSELEQNFRDFYPQTHPPKQELIERMRPILPLERIHVEDIGLKFRQTKILDHWVGEIYDGFLKEMFKQEEVKNIT